MKLLRKAWGVQYELFDMYALDGMASMVAEPFNRYEPMTVDQDVPFQEFVDFVKFLAPKAWQEERVLPVGVKNGPAVTAWRFDSEHRTVFLRHSAAAGSTRSR
jgi:hypothetical protein